MEKTIEEYFADWENHVFGFGYGTGEPHTLGALKAFFAAVGDERGMACYDFQVIEKAVTPAVCWLLMSTLGRHRIIEYGTSPRYGWLTESGKALQGFLAERSVDALYELCAGPGEHDYCSPDSCNCGPNGYQEGRKCNNPFWKK
jgi:hypothetical protein